MSTTNQANRLAIQGGEALCTEPWPLPWHGPAAIGEEEVEAVTGVLRSRKLFRFLDHENSWCTRFEKHFRDMTGCRHALAVGGGTAALISGLVGIGVGDGDEVIIPAHTYIASASAVIIVGAVPVLAEIDESLTIDPTRIEALITPRTKAIMPVHMRGIPCDMDPILALAKRRDLKIIEDVAQACGATYKGRRCGSLGDVGCFSVQQYKMITAGEGGVVVTDDEVIFERAALRHDSAMHFWNPGKHAHAAFAGENFRMNEMEGALGCVQFGRLAGIIERCRALRGRVREGIAGLPGLRMHRCADPDGDCGISLVVYLESGGEAKRFSKALRAEGVPCNSIYDQGIPDRHIYCYWEYVMEKGSHDPLGRPWTSPAHDQERVYTPDMCPRTLDILGKAVLLPFSQTYEDRHADLMIEAVRKVTALL